MTLLDGLGATFTAAFIVALFLYLEWLDFRVRERREDQRVLDGMDALTAVLPAVDLANPPVHIERSPLARPVTVQSGPRHAADSYARPHNHQPRHGFTTDRDPLIAARIEKTGIFDTAELHEMLDAELVTVEPVRTYTEPAVQLTLPLRGVVEYGEVTGRG